MLKTFSGDGSGSALTGFEKKIAGSVPDDAQVPAPILKSVRFMLAGAAVTAVIGVYSIIALLADPRLFNNGVQPAGSQVVQAVVYDIVSTLVFMALWVLMARKNRSGTIWARIAATVLFVISTYNLYGGINSLHGGETIRVLNIVSFVLAVAEWICGLIAVALLWRRESSVYFRERSAR